MLQYLATDCPGKAFIRTSRFQRSSRPQTPAIGLGLTRHCSRPRPHIPQQHWRAAFDKPPRLHIHNRGLLGDQTMGLRPFGKRPQSIRPCSAVRTSNTHHTMSPMPSLLLNSKKEILQPREARSGRPALTIALFRYRDTRFINQ
jgi:hypothetical protein